MTKINRIKLASTGVVLTFGLLGAGCVVVPAVPPPGYAYTQPVPPPPGVVYMQPTYPAPAVGFTWVYHPRYGWGWYHPRRGWHRGWR